MGSGGDRKKARQGGIHELEIYCFKGKDERRKQTKEIAI